MSDSKTYNWHIKVKPLLYRLAAVCACCLSVFSILGMIGSISGVSPSASVYFLAIHNEDSTTGAAIVVFVLITLFYAAYITLWSIFQMKVSGMVLLYFY